MISSTARKLVIFRVHRGLQRAGYGAAHVLTGREVGADGAAGQGPAGGVHGGSVAGTRQQVDEPEFLAASVDQDGLSSS